MQNLLGGNKIAFFSLAIMDIALADTHMLCLYCFILFPWSHSQFQTQATQSPSMHFVVVSFFVLFKVPFLMAPISTVD